MITGRGARMGRSARAGLRDSRTQGQALGDVITKRKPRSNLEILGYVLMGAGALLLFLFGDDEGRGEGAR